MLATFSQILFFDAIVVFKNVIQISADILTSWRNSQNLNTFAIHSLLLSVYNVAIWSRFCTHATTSRSQEHCGIQHMCRCHVESAPTTKAFGGIKEKKKSTWNLAFCPRPVYPICSRTFGDVSGILLACKLNPAWKNISPLKHWQSHYIPKIIPQMHLHPGQFQIFQQSFRDQVWQFLIFHLRTPTVIFFTQ